MKTVTDEFEKHIGAVEYDAFVMKMIKWYYGYDYKPAWCAISMSYMMNQMGLLDQIGGKNQNCYEMLNSIKAAVKATGKGKLYMKEELKGKLIPRGSIIFILHDDPPMKLKSGKHVTSCYKDFVYKGTGSYESLGGNQRVPYKDKDGKTKEHDGIFVKSYAQSRIWAVFMPDYDAHHTLRQGDSGAEVKELQQDLKKLGFGRITGKRLLAGGNYKTNTFNTVKEFQKWTKCCTPDGVCGPKTWAMIDKMLAEPLHTAGAIKNVNVRTGPSVDFKRISSVKDGVIVQYTNLIGNWLYIPAKKGWSKSSYYKL